MGDFPNSNSADAASLSVLNYLCEASGIEFDPTRAAQAVRVANRDIPPTHARAARQRLAQAAVALGVQLSSRRFSVREAIRYVAESTPLAVFTVMPGGTARWFVLAEGRGSSGRLAPLTPGDQDHWQDAHELAQALGAVDADEVLEWQLPQPAQPLAAARSEVEEEPGHSHQHSHHQQHSHLPHLPPFRRLLGLLKPDRADMWIVLIFAIGVGALSLAVPVVAMAVVNTVALGTLVQQLLVLCVALFIALSLAGVLQFLQTIVVEHIQRRVFVRVANDLAHRLPRVDVKAFDRQHGPELVNRFFDVLTVQKASATLLLDGITITLQMAIGLMLLGTYHAYLRVFDFMLITSLLLMIIVLGRGAVRSAIRESISKYVVAGWMEEVARHPIAFKTSGGPRLVMEKTDLLVRQYLLHRKSHFRILIRQVGFALFLQAVANVSLLAIGGILVIRGELTLGQLVAAEIVVTLVVATFTKLGKQLEAYYDLLAAVDKLGHLIDLPLERDSGERHLSRTAGAAVIFHKISYTHEGSHHTALHDFSMTITPGERVALVGPNGTGKSTLVDLLFGLRTPDDGWIEIDGADIRNLRLQTLRENIALVKGIEIVEGTVIDNVRMGREDINQADAREALRKVGLLNTVLRLPDGMNTKLWTGGSPLSLGQANRLMIARAIVGQPRLLILDEAIDHMDADIRETVLPAILGPSAHWTLLVITHSDDAARLCDRIVPMIPDPTGSSTGSIPHH